MISNYKLIEKILGAVLITSGILIISIIFWSLKTQFSIVFRNYNISYSDISISKIFFNYHRAFLLAICGILSGIYLLKDRFFGWLLGLIFWSCNIANLSRISLMNYDVDYTDSEFVLLLVTLFVILTMITLMLNKHFLRKYSPQRSSWGILIITIIIYSLDIWITD